MRALPQLFAALLGSGAELIFSGQGVTKIQRTVDHRIGHPHASAVALPFRRTCEDAETVKVFRALCNLVLFFNPELENAHWARTRAIRRYLKAADYSLDGPASGAIAGLDVSPDSYAALSTLLGLLERSIPPEAALVQAIGALDVDGIVLVSRCSVNGFEPDVIKAARRLGLPTILLVFSWDNLSSKAALHEHPDRLLVWNDVQAREAQCFHHVPSERVHTVGAPNFDRFFEELEELETAPRPALNGRRTILYLGSSKASHDEPAIFARWLGAIRSADDPILREANVVLRPHPRGTRRAWEEWTAPPDPRLEIQLASKVVSLARALSGSDAVVALSTSAEIEAAIAGKPVVTFRAGSDAPGQEGLLHFQYLLEQRGGFVVDARDLDEHVARLSDVLHGGYDAVRLSEFVRRFVRPAGLSEMVSPRVAAVILEGIAELAQAPTSLPTGMPHDASERASTHPSTEGHSPEVVPPIDLAWRPASARSSA